MTRSPLVGMEDAIAEELVLSELGVSSRPRLADRYVIVGIRGRGARGLVCRAVDERLERVVALKLYPPIGDPRIEAEIAREARALARLDHPNVVRVHDVALGSLVLGGRTLETSYLSMELVEGRNLRVFLADGPRDEARLTSVMLSVGQALAAAHSRGIVHRDVKPENVMIDDSGEVRVVDFGLARTIAGLDDSVEAPRDSDPESPAAPLATSFGKLTGTIEYMAPESRDGVADSRSDQFSYAVTTWECLSGTLPFDARGEVWRDPRIRPYDGSDTIPDRFKGPLIRAMDRDPENRFPSMEALVAALSPRRSRALGIGLGIGMVSVVALAAALAFGTGPTRDVRDASLTAEPPVDAGTDSAWEAAFDSSADAGVDAGIDASAPRIVDAVVPPVDSCRAVLGRWKVITTVEESRARSVPIGTRSYYTFTLENRDGCDVEVFVVKLGDDTNEVGDAGKLYSADDIRDDHRRLRLGLEDGYVAFDEIFGLASARRARREYRFAVHFEGQRLVGDFYFTDSNDRLVLGGTLSGTRISEGEAPFPELIPTPPGTSTENPP